MKKEDFYYKKIGDVKTSDAKLFLIKLQQDGKRYSTVKTVRGVLRPAFQMAVDDDVLHKNPFGFELAGVVVNDSVTREALTRDQMRKFLKFVHDDNVYCKYYEVVYILWKPPGKAKKPKPRQKSPEEQFQEAKNRCFRILADYLHLLRVWRKEYAPHSPEEVFHPRFVEALQKQSHVEYLLDVLLFGEIEEQAALITDYGKDVIQLEQRMAELAATDAAGTKKHHERHAAAPER